jgi:hypothetical protein
MHGAGYENRYSSGLDPKLHGIYSDDYITTEVMTGHPAVVSDAFSRNTVRKYWLLHDLMRALALRRMSGVEFSAGDIHRQHISWEGGAEVRVNRGAADWSVEGHVLPPYGFYARAGGVEAAIERRDGVIVEWSRSPESHFVNARPPISDRLPIRVSVARVDQIAPRRLVMTFRWEAEEPAPEALRVFVHFVDAAGNIKFQGDHNPIPPANLWQGVVETSVQVNVPDLPATMFGVRIGLYNPQTGQRYLPEGPDDGARRIHLGDLKVEADRTSFTSFDPGPDPWLERMNPEQKQVRFDGVTTNAAIRLSRADGSLWVVPLPQSRKSTARISAAATQVVVRDEAGNILRVGPASVEGDEVLLEIDRGVFAYELR